MKNIPFHYSCPHCACALINNGYVELNIEDRFKQKATIYLSPKPGTYEYFLKPAVNFEKGEMIDFFCSHCDEKLTSDKHQDFVELNLKINQVVIFEVLFSRIAGVRKTYIITEDSIDYYGDELKEHIETNSTEYIPNPSYHRQNHMTA